MKTKWKILIWFAVGVVLGVAYQTTYRLAYLDGYGDALDWCSEECARQIDEVLWRQSLMNEIGDSLITQMDTIETPDTLCGIYIAHPVKIRSNEIYLGSGIASPDSLRDTTKLPDTLPAGSGAPNMRYKLPPDTELGRP